MEPTLDDIDFELPGVDQVAFVVEDVHEGVKRFTNVLGIQPWTGYRFEPPDLVDQTYRGEPEQYGMHLALGDAGPTTFELIESTMGRNIYRDHLEEHGEGLHHIAYYSESESEANQLVTAFENTGMPVLQYGMYRGTEFWYLDARNELNGLIFEVVNRRNTEERDPSFRYPEA